MLKATKNLYFGRENPYWFTYNPRANSVLRYISDHRDGISTIFRAPAPGFVGVIVEILDQDMAARHGLPRVFTVSDGHAANDAISQKIGRLLIDEADAEFSDDDDAGCVPGRTYYTGDRSLWDTTERHFHSDTTHGSTIQIARFNSERWNDHYVLPNNCYSYACNVIIQSGSQSNWPHPGLCRTGTIPQNDNDLINGLNIDRIFRLEKGMAPVTGTDRIPAWIAALATGFPRGGDDESRWDYHWLRKVWDGTGGYCWAHKRGASPVTHLTRNGTALITDPESEARKYGYDKFLGYYVIWAASICACI